MRNQTRKRRSSRLGATATEFAIILPFLVLMAVACCDFSRIIHHRQMICNAARTGAETGAMKQFTEYTLPDWEECVRQSILAELSNVVGFNESATQINVSSVEDGAGVQIISVDVTSQFQTVIDWPVLPTDVTLFQHAEFRQFR